MCDPRDGGWRLVPPRTNHILTSGDTTPPKLVPLTTLEGLEFDPALSPDGEQVAFTWDPESRDDWDIHLKLVGSSEVRRLRCWPNARRPPGATRDRADAPRGRDAADPFVSPDGQTILFPRGTRTADLMFDRQLPVKRAPLLLLPRRHISLPEAVRRATPRQGFSPATARLV